VEFASAIHNYGVEKLYSDLKSNGEITKTYPLGTFRTDFKRMKAGANGFLNEPALISAICELLHFPASALFGGPVSSDVENREMIKAAIHDSIQDAERQKKSPKKQVYSPRIIDRTKRVFKIIEDIFLPFSDKQFTTEPIFKLSIDYSLHDKAWDHEKEIRIKSLLDKILKGSKGDAYINYCQFNMPCPQNLFPNIDPYDIYWNLCLIISYQLSCIESLYSVFQKSKTIKNKTTKGQPAKIDVVKITQDITLENEGQDVFASELRNFCEVFDNTINNPDENIIYNLKKSTLTELEIEQFYKKIISNFQYILYTLLYPTPAKMSPKNSLEDSLVNLLIKPKKFYMNYYELTITDKEIDILRENTRILQDKNVGPVNHSGQNTAKSIKVSKLVSKTDFENYINKITIPKGGK
jgi:hypothetical protein